jgi:hypothetical protein
VLSGIARAFSTGLGRLFIHNGTGADGPVLHGPRLLLGSQGPGLESGVWFCNEGTAHVYTNVYPL